MKFQIYQMICGAVMLLCPTAFGFEYLGCFKDAHDRDLPLFNELGGANSPHTCIAICSALGYKYAGLQYTGQCFCGNNYGKHGSANKNDCSAVCPGSSGFKCGGTWRNSVYMTSKQVASEQYLGCFIDNSNRDLPKFTEMGSNNKPSACIARCIELGYKYAGLQYTGQCFCGNNFGTYGSGNECSAVCPASSQDKCGGTWRNSVYMTKNIAGEQYLGCFIDASNRDLPRFNELGDKNKPSSCIARCKGLGYAYAGLQYTGQCFCGNSFGKYNIVADSQCGAICPADRSKKCGGTWRNSVYKV